MLIRVSGVHVVGMDGGNVYVHAEFRMCHVLQGDTRQTILIRVLLLNKVRRMTDLSPVITSRERLLAQILFVDNGIGFRVNLRSTST